MAITEKIFHLLGNLLFERPARNRSLQELRAELEQTGQEAERRIAAARDTDDNCETLRHVIAIERWGQRRLEVFLGEPYVRDECDAYYPAAGAGLDALQERFTEARAQTLALARRLQEAGVNGERAVLHNQWGMLSAQGWLNYLNGHAIRDVKGLKRG